MATSNWLVAKRMAIYFGSRALCHALELIGWFVSLFFAPKRSQIPTIDDINLVTPAVKLSKQIKSGHVTSEEVVESFIARIKRVNPILNAMVDRRFELAIKEAREIDRKLSEARDGTGDKSILDLELVGIPVSIKETISVDGYAFTGGLLGRRFIKAPEDAEAVQGLREKGLIVIGLTNVPEMAMWWDSSNPLYGRTNNPYDLSRIPGGSSGGEGALISAAGSLVGLGSDIAGSIRIPANFCGIFGHKPTPYIVPTIGMYPTTMGEREKLLGVGPLTRYACDLIPMLKAAASHRWLKLKLDDPVDLSKLKVFYVEEIGDPLASRCNSDILARIEQAVSHLVNKFKIKAEKVTFDEFRHGMFLWSAEMNKAPGPTIKGQIKCGNGEMHPLVELVKKPFGLSDHTTNSILAAGLELMSPVCESNENLALIRQVANLRKKFNDMLGETGILLMPTHPEPAVHHWATLLKVFNVSYTSMTSVLEAPITQCPLGLSKEGLPFGVQILARPYNDRLTLAVALEFEKAFGGWQPPCRIDTDTSSSEAAAPSDRFHNCIFYIKLLVKLSVLSA